MEHSSDPAGAPRGASGLPGGAPPPVPDDAAALLAAVNDVADQLSKSVKGTFDFTIRTSSSAQALQKLTLMLNFLIDSTRRNLEDVRDKNQKLAAQLETIEQQRRAIQELSTPILQLWEGILVLPVIGFVDSVRSQQMMGRLLEEIVERQARHVIIDVTGVAVMDTQTADYFTKIFNSVRLLGAQCLLTGIRPAVAQTLVHIGVQLDQVTTRRNLQQGLRECLRLLDRERSARAQAPADAP
jgi:anti-anti-sigma regulatory factor